MSSSNLVRIGYKKEQAYGVTPAAVKASLVVQDITYQAIKGGTPGNLFTVEYVDTVTAGAEIASIVGRKITVAIEDGVSTATQVAAALTAILADLVTLGVSFSITGTAGDAQNTYPETSFTGGSLEFKTARFISEQYSGTPETTESAQIRTDRMSSGQVVTSLAVEGGHNFELAKEEAIEDFLESAMFNSWQTFLSVAVALTLNITTKKITRAAGSFINEGLEVGTFIKLSGFPSAVNNVVVMVTSVTALEITYAGSTQMTSEVGTGYQICDRLSIGTTKKSITIEKTFLDLTDKAIIYRGSLVSQMELNIEYGSLISGSFQTMGNGYTPVASAAGFASYNEFFKAPATTNSMNGSVDMPFISTNVTGVWDQEAFCLQNLNLTLNNNLTVQNCIGKIAPEDYSAGTAQITADLSSYLKDGNWGMLSRKLSQQPFSLGFLVENNDGFYGFYIPALQVSFDDPQSGGANQEISMEMSGVARVGVNGESSLYIYRIPSV